MRGRLDAVLLIAFIIVASIGLARGSELYKDPEKGNFPPQFVSSKLPIELREYDYFMRIRLFATSIANPKELAKYSKGGLVIFDDVVDNQDIYNIILPLYKEGGVMFGVLSDSKFTPLDISTDTCDSNDTLCKIETYKSHADTLQGFAAIYETGEGDVRLPSKMSYIWKTAN